MKTLELLKNVKAIANTNAIKGGIEVDTAVSVTSIDINIDYKLIEVSKDVVIKETNVKGN